MVPWFNCVAMPTFAQLRMENTNSELHYGAMYSILQCPAHRLSGIGTVPIFTGGRGGSAWLFKV